MKSALFGSDNASPSVSAAEYNRINANHQSTWSATESLRAEVVPVSFTLSSWYVQLGTAPGGVASFTFTVMKNGAATSVEAIISGASTSATDTVNSVSFAAGDTISIRSTPSGTPATSALQYWNAQLSTGSQTAPLLMGTAPASTTITQYSGVMGGITTTSGWSASESDAQIVVPTSGTISNLYASAASAPSSGRSWQLTVMHNGAASSVQATIANTNTTANDTTNSFNVTAGDTLTIRSVPSGTPTAANLSFGLVFTPTINGESFFGFGSGQVPSNSATQYEQPFGIGGLAWTATETARFIMPGPYLLKAMYVKLGTAPGAGTSRTFTLRRSSVNTAITLPIANAATTGSVIADVTFAQGEFLTLQATPAGTPAALAGGVHTGVLIYIPPDAASFTPLVIVY